MRTRPLVLGRHRRPCLHRLGGPPPPRPGGTTHDPALAALPLWPDTVEAFCADRACSIRSAATRKSWGYTYRWLQRLHPDKPVGGFCADDLVAFVTQRGWVGPRWASSTARNYRSALQSLFGWAHRAGRIPLDPAWRLGQRVRIRRVRVWQPHWLSEPQIATLLRAAEGDGPLAWRNRTLLMLGLFAGLRTGEMHRLRWPHLDLVHGMAEIVGKGARPASVALAPQLRHQLVAWRTGLCEVVHGAVGDGPVLPVLVATAGRTGPFEAVRPVRPLSIEGIRRVVNTHGKAIGIDYLRPRDLRRTLAGILDARDTPIQDIRIVLRHEQIASTQGYLSENPLRARRCLQKFAIDLD